MRLRIFQVLFMSILLAAFSCQNAEKSKIVKTQSSAKSGKKLNVLFIIADDLNCDLGAYGNNVVHTPNIDRLAQRGIVFENAHNQYPLCGPSRASFMTGMYTNQTKITENNMNLRNSVPDVITLGQRFRQQGYQSVRIGKMFHYDNPSAIGTSGMMTSILGIKLLIHMEETKLKNIKSTPLFQEGMAVP